MLVLLINLASFGVNNTMFGGLKNAQFHGSVVNVELCLNTNDLLSILTYAR